jgi:FMN-dependent oxidoreductase (nitrilotriacetate monooxygenase family)
MNGESRQLKLGAFLRPPGHHVAAWRHPAATEDAGVNFQHYVQLAQTAERGLFDLIFMADSVTVFDAPADVLSLTSYVVWFEPFSLLSALAAVTSQIGLVCTATTTYDQPFHIARRFASLDQISGGRCGWNLVTSMQAAEAKNFGCDVHMQHDERYERAREFAHVVRGLWDSWDDDAFIRDKARGVFFDPAALHVLDHRGEHFRVRGPLNVARSPQGRPVMVQAGSSDAGKELAAETADVVFTAQQSLAEAKAFYADLKRRLPRYGRGPDDVKVMPGLFATVGCTEQEARDKYEELQQLIHPTVGLMLLSAFLGYDVSGLDPDGPLPELPPQVLATSRARLLSDLARRESLTIRQLYMRMAGARGHRQIYGTPAQIADEMEAWFKEEAADGFNVMPPIEPASLDDFVALVIPELQRRGLFRTAYEGATLRESLGLKRPVNRHVATRRRSAAAE